MFHPSNKNLLPQCCPAKHRMCRNLTVKSIEGLQPALPGRRYDVADGIVPGFGVRVSDKGKKSYTVTARFPGSANPTRRTIAAVNAIDLAVARETAPAWLAQIDRQAIAVPSFGDVVRFLAVNRSVFVPHIMGYSFYAMALFGILGWSPALLMRAYGFSAAQTGLWLGAMAIVASGSGVLVSGYIMDKRSKRGFADGAFSIGIVGALGMVGSLAVLHLAGRTNIALAALAVALFFSSFAMPPSAAVIQTVVPSAMRSRVAALFLFFNSFLGLAAGSALIGILNDTVFRIEGLRYSLPLVAGVAAVVAAVLLRAGIKPYVALMETTDFSGGGDVVLGKVPKPQGTVTTWGDAAE
jgi:hypothetical protein